MLAARLVSVDEGEAWVKAGILIVQAKCLTSVRSCGRWTVWQSERAGNRTRGRRTVFSTTFRANGVRARTDGITSASGAAS
ncbi:hypothetical protein D1F64_20030 [Breoghania sp. L-A4]|nr:hypothetical protein D1F64_20030 [Breoghania sp. L-A4]